MAADLVAALDALDRAVTHASVVLTDEELGPIAELAREIRRRRGFLGSTVVMALAGGTGSGKSSLLNALAGEQVAPTGAIRPTTDRPLAWIPRSPEPGIVRLLDQAGIEDRVAQERFPSLAVIDLPDHDSVELEHRATVEQLLPRVDAVAWVLDPEKYNDTALHDRYLDPLSGYRSQFVFVLNQVDRLEAGEADGLVADLVRTLARDGIPDPEIFVVAARPPLGPARGVEDLAHFLDVRMEAKRVAVGKLVEDLRRAGRRLSEATGVAEGTGLDFDRRWEEQRDRASARIAALAAGEEYVRLSERAGERQASRVGGALPSRLAALATGTVLGRALGGRSLDEGPHRALHDWSARPGLESTLGDLGEFATDLSFETGGAFGRRLREEFGPERIERDIRSGVGAALAEPAPTVRSPVWWRFVGAAQLVALLTIVAGAVWGWARPETLERGRWPLPLLLVVAGLVVTVFLGRIIRWSGRRRGRRAALSHRAALEEAVRDELDHNLGIPLRRLLRERALVAASLAEVSVATAGAGPKRRG